MNQQCIFNQDFKIDEAAKAVSCSCLHQGLRRQIFIEMPDGWQLDAWLAQVVEDGFFWEEERQHPLTWCCLTSCFTLLYTHSSNQHSFVPKPARSYVLLHSIGGLASPDYPHINSLIPKPCLVELNYQPQ